jgi:hypothetical protein
MGDSGIVVGILEVAMTRLRSVLALSTLLLVGCSSAPGSDGLRESFAQQLSANTFISDFQRNGDTMTFKGPRPDGTPAMWQVHIDTATVAEQASNTRQPYKGTVSSTWSVDGQPVTITGGDSNLPLELTSNGLSQECWAFWEADAKRWSWE